MMNLKSKIQAAANRAASGPDRGKLVAKVQSVRMENKADRAEKKLGNYVNSPKAPQSTKAQYAEAKKYLGGEYQGKPLNRMTDATYSDPKAAVYANKAKKAEVKSEISYNRYKAKNQ